MLSIIFLMFLDVNCLTFSDVELRRFRKRTHDMFIHAYDNYMNHAFPLDELRPLTCDGYNPWGGFSLTLIDSLDTLVVLKEYERFRVAYDLACNMSFAIDANVSVFETNIRVIGGLLAGHFLSKKAGIDVPRGWPCVGPLLDKALDVAIRLLPAFNTTTGMPYGTVNLITGVPENETTVTCTAGIGTFTLEFVTLSRLTGNPEFEQAAFRALNYLWKKRSYINLVGNHIDVKTGNWVLRDMTIGSGVDSYIEYLVKGAFLLHEPSLLAMFYLHLNAIEKYLRVGNWHVHADYLTGSKTRAMFQSLEAFYPGLLSLVGLTDKAYEILLHNHKIWTKFGALPEYFDIINDVIFPEGAAFPLRPEHAESIMYINRAFNGANYEVLSMAVDVLTAIESFCKVPCGFCGIKDVRYRSLENRMESFFMAETLKYLYLVFDDALSFSEYHAGVTKQVPLEFANTQANYLFNTEGHLIDVNAIRICSHQPIANESELQEKRRTFMSSLRANPEFACMMENYTDPHLDLPILNDESFVTMICSPVSSF